MFSTFREPRKGSRLRSPQNRHPRVQAQLARATQLQHWLCTVGTKGDTIGSPMSGLNVYVYIYISFNVYSSGSSSHNLYGHFTHSQPNKAGSQLMTCFRLRASKTTHNPFSNPNAPWDRHLCGPIRPQVQLMGSDRATHGANMC